MTCTVFILRSFDHNSYTSRGKRNGREKGPSRVKEGGREGGREEGGERGEGRGDGGGRREGEGDKARTSCTFIFSLSCR